MTEPTPDPTPDPKDVQAVAEAAASAAEQSRTPAEAQTNIDAAVRREGAKLQLDEEQIGQLAETTTRMMIEQMQALGAFDAPPPPEPSPQPPASVDDGTPAPAAVEPRKRTLAERFAGLE